MISVNAKEKFRVSARHDVKRHEFRMGTTVPCLRQAPSRRAIMREFATLQPFETLELDSPGGRVAEALAMAANTDARGITKQQWSFLCVP
jgi:hypothetical protein